jgi:para-nitrobenzyl esterase
MMKRCIVLLSAFLPFAHAAIDGSVRTESGLVSGIRGSGPEERVFKGIPFAAPPVGKLRWRAPQPFAHWEGVRKADKFAAMCTQSQYDPAGNFMGDGKPEPISEDCLSLNVWTTAKSPNARQPVMVWVYGGAFSVGSSALGSYSGEELAKKGVVVVSFNYRLGIFGFFAHPELSAESDRHVSGNYGMLDQIAALQWVQRNIAAFGGNPKNVTVFGQSAGSISVNLVNASPLAKGLIHRVIGESSAAFDMSLLSGGVIGIQKLSEAEQVGVKIAQSVGASSLADLRAKPAEELRRAGGRMRFLPIMDGYFLPLDVYAIYASGKQNDVPILVGSVSNEAGGEGPTAQLFIEQARKTYGDMADEFLKVFPASTDEEAKASFHDSSRDRKVATMRTWARLQTETGKSKAYLWYFTHVPPQPNKERYGAFHGAEIYYVLRTFGYKPWPWDDTDRKLGEAVSDYWVNFATKGDPNGKGLLRWPPFDPNVDLLMEFGDKPILHPQPHKAGADFFEASYSAYSVSIKHDTPAGGKH